MFGARTSSSGFIERSVCALTPSVQLVDDCAFCRWLRAESATRVYEDASVFVEVDPRQPHRGHLLVMPTAHVENIFELDEATASAHQEVPHFHLHLMPRWHDDELLRIYPRPVETPDPSIRSQMAHDIRRHL